MTVCTVYRYATSPPFITYAMLADSRCSYSFTPRGLMIFRYLFDDVAAEPFFLAAGLASYALPWGVLILCAYATRDS
jgi:hypothetical protein